MAKPLISGRSAVLLAAILLMTAARPLFCQTAISNEQLLADASKRAVSILFDSLNISTGPFTVVWEPGIDEIVAGGVIESLQNRGFILKNSETPPGDSLVAIKVRLSALQFSYQKGESRGFWKKPFIKRTLVGQIAIILTGKCGYSGFLDIIARDQIHSNEANFAASLRYNQLAPKIPRLGAGSFVEPLAVMATVGGLMYLFFASR
jgi:hypothetical protein